MDNETHSCDQPKYLSAEHITLMKGLLVYIYLCTYIYIYILYSIKTQHVKAHIFKTVSMVVY